MKNLKNGDMFVNPGQVNAPTNGEKKKKNLPKI